MFGIENSANNFGRSAGLLANTFAQRPTTAALGTIFIASDTLIMYRWSGTVWQTIGGGGGVFGGATNGLSIYGAAVGLGGILIANTTVDCASSYTFTFDNITLFTIGNYTQPTFIVNSGADQIYTYHNFQQKGIFLNYVLGSYILGHTGAGNYIDVYDGINEIRTYLVGNGWGLNVTTGYTKIGDWAGSGSNLSTIYDFMTNRITNFSTDGYYNFQQIQAFANNAAALAGGLTVGDIYRHSGGTGEQLHIVF